MKTVLFICTGNIFRSMTAEYAFRAQINNLPFRSESAGIEAKQQVMYPPVKNRLIELGIDPSAHIQRKLTQDMLNQVVLPVAMGIDHQTFIRATFNRDVPLFNRIALGTDDPIKDTWEAVPDWNSDENARQTYAVYVVDTIWQVMPGFIQNMENFMA